MTGRHAGISSPDLTLPTEPGTVIAVGQWWFVRLRPYDVGLPSAWELLPVPQEFGGTVTDLGLTTQCIYGDDWVQREVEHEGSFEIIAHPLDAEQRAGISEALTRATNCLLGGHEHDLAQVCAFLDGESQAHALTRSKLVAAQEQHELDMIWITRARRWIVKARAFMKPLSFQKHADAVPLVIEAAALIGEE